MAGIVSEEAGVGRSMEGILSGQRCQSGEALAEWRSSEQVENGMPSTSPPYWDTDDDDDGGLKPSELFGKYTWKIGKFSQTNKRELRSSAFEVGGYKWYILIYPQGCDVCNHLSLFLCVANHDKLLPGWSHFAQFTIAVVNKDMKKSKYSDTLHRFWKKEHDWGWKKFMELSKVSDGFLDASDTLIIKAQVQVIREKADRPFRCLDCLYRRELVRVYLTNVEQICRRFVEERRGKLGRLIEDKNRWSSFCSFWLGKNQNIRRDMSREKMDAILKIVVKHFFIEKEVTSTLVMDSLYSGLKALEGYTRSKKGRVKSVDAEEMPAPIVRVEKDMFVLVDDVLILLERAAMEPLPPKDEKGPQNRTKDGNSGEDFNKDSIERDERRLTELGRRTVEIFVLAHIFNHKIEVAYHEAVAFKRQEELIREEGEQKAKRGASEKEKKSKKKQSKQKRNSRKGKDKMREEMPCLVAQENHKVQAINEDKDVILDEQSGVEKPDNHEDASDATDSVDGIIDIVQADSEYRDASPVNWDTDTSEVHPPTEASSSGVSGLSSVSNGTSEKRSTSVVDDSSSTCSTDSVPSVVLNDPYKGNFYSNWQHEKFPSSGKNHRGKAASDARWTTEDIQTSELALDARDQSNVTDISKATEGEFEAAVYSLQDRVTCPEQHVEQIKDKGKSVPLKKKLNGKDLSDVERASKEKVVVQSSPGNSPKSPAKNLGSARLKAEIYSSATVDSIQVKKASSSFPKQVSQHSGLSKAESQNSLAKMAEKPLLQQVPVISRPSSAPLVPGSRPTAPLISMVQSSPLLARSISAVGRLGPDPSPATHSYVPQSYRNAIVGNSVGSSSSGFPPTSSTSLGANLSPVNILTPSLASSPLFLAPSSDRVDPNCVQSRFLFGLVMRDVFQNGTHWVEDSQRDAGRSMHGESSSQMNGIHNLDLCKTSHRGFPEYFSGELVTQISGCQSQVGVAEEFPHIDIINDLLDDENGVGKTAGAGAVYQSQSNSPYLLNKQDAFQCDVGVSDDLASSSSSSCRIERMRSYHEGFQRGYSSSATQFDTLRDFIPQASRLNYANEHMDGLIPNQWHMSGADLSLMSLRNVDDGLQYFNPEYSNLACGVNGYTVYPPSNGH